MTTERERIYQAEYRAKNKERLAAYHKMHYQANKERINKQQADYAKQHRESIASYLAEYRKTWDAINAQRRAAYTAKYHSRYPEMYAARRMVNREIERGRFPRASTMVCEVCGEALAAHWHHHNGYDPGHELDVIAVCLECHVKEHKETDNGK